MKENGKKKDWRLFDHLNYIINWCNLA